MLPGWERTPLPRQHKMSPSRASFRRTTIGSAAGSGEELGWNQESGWFGLESSRSSVVLRGWLSWSCS